AGLCPDGGPRRPARAAPAGEARGAATRPRHRRADLSRDVRGGVEDDGTKLGPVADPAPPEPGHLCDRPAPQGPCRRLARINGSKPPRVRRHPPHTPPPTRPSLPSPP